MVVKLVAEVEILEDARSGNLPLLLVSICYPEDPNLTVKNSAEARR